MANTKKKRLIRSHNNPAWPKISWCCSSSSSSVYAPLLPLREEKENANRYIRAWLGLFWLPFCWGSTEERVVAFFYFSPESV